MDIEDCIERIKNLPPPRKTFMEIMKVNRSEVHIANLLAYFFRSEESHGLGKVFLKSLFETHSYHFKKKKKTEEDEASEKAELEKEAKKESLLFKYGRKRNIETGSFEKATPPESIDSFIDNLSNVQVKTEDPTADTQEKQKRIDLVLSTDECVVCIEFKINHELNNPLRIYQERIENKEKKFYEKNEEQRDLFFIVLTPYKKAPSEAVQEFIDGGKNEFREMVLSHFVENVVKNIPANYFIENVNNPYSQYLVDFIQTINNRAINHWRTLVLLDLKAKLPAGLKTVHEPRYFGFLQFHFGGFRYKIRVRHNHQFVIEKWTKPNGKNYELEKTYKTFELSMEGYEAVLTAVKEIMMNSSL